MDGSFELYVRVTVSGTPRAATDASVLTAVSAPVSELTGSDCIANGPKTARACLSGSTNPGAPA